GKEGEENVLKRWETGRLVLGDEEFDEDEIREEAVGLARGIAGFDIEYLAEKDDWKNEWDSTDIETSDKLPLAVRIRLAFPIAGEKKETRDFETTVSLRIPPIDRSKRAGAPAVPEESAGGEGENPAPGAEGEESP
ncbi:MAG: hypothetical protein ACRD1Z_10785, partial [Vicinamibacteria bacterium]